MVKVQISRHENCTQASVEGVIDEKVDLKALIGPVEKMLKISAGGIKRFNSLGIKHWIKYFQGLIHEGVSVEFSDCSPAMVEQCNTYQNFTTKAIVTSVQLPFRCSACKNYFVITRTVKELREKKFQIDDVPCSSCRQLAGFDDLPQSYFGFMM